MTRLIAVLSAFASILTVAASEQQMHFANFEDKHMQDAHGVEVLDEVAFFKIHDSNGDGYWDESDLRAMYGLERDIDPNAHHVRTIVDRALQDLDKDKDGMISLAEYMKSQLPDWTPEEVREEKQWMDHHPPQKGTPKSFHHSEQPQWSTDDDDDDDDEQEEAKDNKHEQQEGQREGDFVPDKFRAN